jgi:methylaspartate mutase epsilon subunit
MKMSDEEFFAERQTLFAESPASFFDWEETARTFTKSNRKSVFDVLSSAESPLVQPRSGVSNHKKMIELLKHLDDFGGPDILTITIDAYTRLNKYEKAASAENLNGYPLIHHGVEKVEQLQDAVRVPLQVRHGSPDARLLAEMSFRSRITAFEGGGITYNIPYSKSVPIAHSLKTWAYVDRLAGKLAEKNIVIDRETFGSLTGVLTPPSISIAISLLEAALAVEQGVKCITIGFPETGAMIQDVAALQVIPTLAKKYFTQLGFESVFVFTSFHQWMGSFPAASPQALALIGASVGSAVIGRATKMINKTFQEAAGVPTAESNAFSIKYCKSLIAYGKEWPQLSLPESVLEEEKFWISRQVHEILEAVGRLEGAHLSEQIVRAFELGILDIPFPASQFVKGDVIPARDSNRAIRYLQFGAIPFSEASKKFEHRRLEQHETQPLYKRVFKDIQALAELN